MYKRQVDVNVLTLLVSLLKMQKDLKYSYSKNPNFVHSFCIDKRLLLFVELSPGPEDRSVLYLQEHHRSQNDTLMEVNVRYW